MLIALRTMVVAATLVIGLGQSLAAADNLLGHSNSSCRYKGSPAVGTQYKISIRAGKNGNPETLPVPTNPDVNGGVISVGRDGGALRDLLSAGTWAGMGTPPGSKGWKYRNRNAPSGGVVSTLSITTRAIKLTAKGTGTMPVPASPNGIIQTVISVDDQTYCTEAVGPHAKEVDSDKIQSKDQSPPLACPPCLVGADSDSDRLDDCYETNTGVFVSATDTGTDPFESDTDGDALDDGDEVLGTSAGLDLPSLGTNPLRKDLLVEYDWFDDSIDCGAHSHRPTAAALNLVTAAFAAAPVSNPDGSSGIHFIHDRGQGGVFSGGNLIADPDGVFTGDVNSAEFVAYKATHFASDRHRYFRYVILPHYYNTNSFSSGYAELFGDDMIVSLYCANSDHNVAHTIMHELGHNLGLLHGGTDNCNYKPNYNSVMNYIYQFPGIDADCDPLGDGVLSYSVGNRIALDENNLDENQGTCGAPAWDWNGNTVIESGVATDVNSSEPNQPMWCQGALTTLRDANDWGNLFFGGLAEFDGAPALLTRFIECDNPAPLP